jgi:hypothetical protein
MRLALAAFAYEFMAHSIMTDDDYDSLSREVDLSIDTGNETMDKFYRDNFMSDTGMWVRSHPELDKLECTYYQIFGRQL